MATQGRPAGGPTLGWRMKPLWGKDSGPVGMKPRGGKAQGRPADGPTLGWRMKPLWGKGSGLAGMKPRGGKAQGRPADGPTLGWRIEPRWGPVVFRFRDVCTIAPTLGWRMKPRWGSTPGGFDRQSWVATSKAVFIPTGFRPPAQGCGHAATLGTQLA